MSDPRREPVRADRVRAIPRQFSWIDRDLLHRGFFEDLSRDQIALYFFLVLVAGPEGTSFWSHARVAQWLDLSLGEMLEALRGLIKKDLVAFSYPTSQVLSLPQIKER